MFNELYTVLYDGEYVGGFDTYIEALACYNELIDGRGTDHEVQIVLVVMGPR